MPTKLVKFSLLILLLCLAGTSGIFYLRNARMFPNTDDAYIQANIVHIAPQVSGKVSRVYVKNLAYVTKGQTLFDIDPMPFILAVNKAKANLDQVKQQVLAQINAVSIAEATVLQRQAELAATEKATYRTMFLVNKLLYPAAAGDEAIRNLKVAQAALMTAESQLKQAQNQLGDSDAHNATIRDAHAMLAQANLNLSYTHITAPENGYIVNFSLREGTEVSAYQETFAVIDDSGWWTTANFKETQLERIRPGQLATVRVDMYPNHVFHGKVISISAGSGASFSLLPPENATGNWVKVTQRFPVRIEITDPDAHFPLRFGASSQVTIDTSDPSKLTKAQGIVPSAALSSRE